MRNEKSFINYKNTAYEEVFHLKHEPDNVRTIVRSEKF